MTDVSKHIEKILALSTAHMPETSPDFHDLTVFGFEHGYVLWVTSFPFEEDDNGLWSDPDSIWISPIMKVALEQGCRLIVFDCDADVLDGLETWEW